MPEIAFNRLILWIIILLVLLGIAWFLIRRQRRRATPRHRPPAP